MPNHRICPSFHPKKMEKSMQWVHITVEGKTAPDWYKSGSDCFRIISHPIFCSRQVNIIHYAVFCGVLVGKIEVLVSFVLGI